MRRLAFERPPSAISIAGRLQRSGIEQFRFVERAAHDQERPLTQQARRLDHASTVIEDDRVRHLAA